MRTKTRTRTIGKKMEWTRIKSCVVLYSQMLQGALQWIAQGLEIFVGLTLSRPENIPVETYVTIDITLLLALRRRPYVYVLQRPYLHCLFARSAPSCLLDYGDILQQLLGLRLGQKVT